jgi:hypothetical protein
MIFWKGLTGKSVLDQGQSKKAANPAPEPSTSLMMCAGVLLMLLRKM